MSNPNTNPSTSPTQYDDAIDEETSIDLWDIATAIGEEKKFIVMLTSLIVAITAAISLLMTPQYAAKVTFIVPSPAAGGSAAQALANLGGMMGSGGAASLLGGSKSTDEMYMEFLKEQSITNSLIEQFGLQKRWGKNSLSQTRDQLKTITLIASNKKAGLMSVQVTDPDPAFAAELANAYVAALKNTLRNFAVGEARQRQQYYEDQLIRAKIELKKTTDYREMRVRESVLVIIMNQFEVATLDAARESVIQVAEAAVPPEQRVTPKRTRMVQVAGAAGLFLSIVLALLRRKWRAIKEDPEDQSHLSSLKAAWRWGAGRK
jgi:capsular polysaccharide biosynthesis protein